MHKALKTWFVICVAVMSSLAVSGRASADLTRTEAIEIARRKLKLGLMTLVAKGYSSVGSEQGRGLQCFHFVGPRKEGIEVLIDVISGAICGVTWARKAMDSSKVVINSTEAKEIAQQFMTEQGLLSTPGIIASDVNLIDNGDEGKAYSFRWIKEVDGVTYPFLAALELSATDGSVTSLRFHEHKVILASVKPSIPLKAAEDIAKEEVKFEPGWKWIDGHLAIGGTGNQQALFWDLTAEGFDLQPSNPRGGLRTIKCSHNILIDANTSKVVRSVKLVILPVQINESKPPPPSPKSIGIRDLWPVWMDESRPFFLFYTSRRTTKPIKRADDEMSVLCQVKANVITAILSLPFISKFPAYARKSGRMTVERWPISPIYVSDLTSEVIGRINDDGRIFRTMSSWNSIGDQVVMSGTHLSSDKVGTEDDDIFVSAISDKLSINSAEYHHCIAFLPGRDILPVFTSNDKWVVFAHKEKQSDEKGWAIYRCKPDAGFQDAGYFKPEKLIEGLPEPERLSPFPDGKRVLISYTGNDNDYEMKNPPEIVDIEAKTRTLLKLPTLFDPDLPKGKPLIPREITVSLDGKQIAFSALRWSGDSKDDGAILIYTCNLDGTNLERITPPTDMPLEPYKYPQEGVTGLNAWEKLQPKLDEGTGIKYGDFAARDKYTEELLKKGAEIRKRKEEEAKKQKEAAAKDKQPAPVAQP